MLFTCPPCYTRVSRLLGQLPSEEKLLSRVFQKRASCARRQTGRWGGLLLFIIVPTNAAEDRRRCPRKGHSPGGHTYMNGHTYTYTYADQMRALFRYGLSTFAIVSVLWLRVRFKCVGRKACVWVCVSWFSSFLLVFHVSYFLLLWETALHFLCFGEEICPPSAWMSWIVVTILSF